MTLSTVNQRASLTPLSSLTTGASTLAATRERLSSDFRATGLSARPHGLSASALAAIRERAFSDLKATAAAGEPATATISDQGRALAARPRVERAQNDSGGDLARFMPEHSVDYSSKALEGAQQSARQIQALLERGS